MDSRIVIIWHVTFAALCALADFADVRERYGKLLGEGALGAHVRPS
jgi:hypothetical protein